MAISSSGYSVRKLSGIKHAKRMVDMRLIAIDLETCLKLVDEIEAIGDYTQPNLVREGLSWALLVKLVSCFTSSESRGHINEKNVFGAAELADYRRFDAIRNLHVAHDVNSMRILEPVALIGPAPNYALDSIQHFVLIRHLNAPDMSKIRVLLDAALKYVMVQEKKRTDLVARELLDMKPADREALPKFDGSPIVLKDVFEPR
jgi:hypothetical protein